MSKLNLLKEHTKKFFSNLLHNILAGYMLAIVGVPLLISWATGTLDFLSHLLNTPTPLWAAICLIGLCGLYIYKTNSKSQPEPNQVNSKGLTSETKYLIKGPYKWEVLVFNNGKFKLNDYPICAEHDLKFIYGGRGKYCPNPKCQNELSEYHEFTVKETVKSLIERNIRNNTWQ